MTRVVIRSINFQLTLDFLLLRLCRFQGGKREELIGITYNRLIRMDAGTGDAIKTWRFSNMKQWNVNWEIKQVKNLENMTIQCHRFSLNIMLFIIRNLLSLCAGS